MKRKALWAVGILAAIFLILVVVLPLVFDANRYRPEIESRLSQSLGRTVKVGSLSLALLSGGIRADDISIADDPAYSTSPFIQAKSLAVGVEMRPLIFDRQIKIESLTLNDPVVQLLQSSNGKWNFASLGGKKEASSGDSSSDLQVNKLAVVNGTLKVGRANGKQQSYTDVSLKASNLSYSSAFPFQFSASAPAGGKISIDGEAGPLSRTDASRTPFHGDVNIEKLDLAATGFLGDDSGLGGVLDYKGKISSDGKQLTSDGTVTANKLKLVKAGSAAKQPVEVQYHSEYDLGRQQGSLEKTSIQTGKSTANLSGTFGAQGANTEVDMKFIADKMNVADIEGLLPALGITLPPGSSLQGGTVSTNLALRGPVDKLVTTGTLIVSNTKLAGFSLGKNLSTIASLAGIKAGADTTIQTLSSNLRIAPEGMRADSLNLVVPELGAITGNGTIAANSALDFHLVAKLANGGGMVGALGQLAGLKGGLQNIPVAVKGTTEKPIFVPDVGSALAGGVAGSALNGSTTGQNANPIGNILGGLLGGKKKKP